MITAPAKRKPFLFFGKKGDIPAASTEDLDRAFLSMCRDVGLMSDDEWQAAVLACSALPANISKTAMAAN
jgi:hypothetical protein